MSDTVHDVPITIDWLRIYLCYGQKNLIHIVYVITFLDLEIYEMIF